MGWIDPEDAEPERQKYREAEHKEKGPSAWVNRKRRKVKDIPVRKWVSKGYLMRGAVTVIAGAPGTAKSSLMMAWACALALDQDHNGFHPELTGPVIAYNVEDDEDEQERRLAATLEQFQVIPEATDDRIIFVGPNNIGILFNRTKEGYMLQSNTMNVIVDLIKEYHPVAIIADPLAELHNCEENDNTALRAVIAKFRALAREFDLAVVLIHHIAKGANVVGNADAARGASAIIGAARIVLTLAEMTEKEAEEFNLRSDRWHRARYVRLDDAKQNYAGFGNPRWFEKKLYLLENGEEVPAMVPWFPPETFEDIDIPTSNAILDEIDLGADDGSLYNVSPTARTLGAWNVVMRHVPGCTEQRAKDVIKKWVAAGMFTTTTYTRSNGQKGNGARVNSEKRPRE